jgi:DNA polymerase-3 subunit gamma/tau
MDAASNTGVDDVREIIDGANYRPVSARFKIYIIDEVHMLSRNAFNALLKTLEEPPDNVKFIFATTEIRKVPVTILSRCQRFDLRRVPNELMTTHLARIAKAEGISAEDGALIQISRASEGSVRDALSLLDQAAAMGADKIDEASIITMLGQAETSQVIAILEACFAGQTAEAVNLFLSADAGGAEAETMLADMLDLLHQASLIAAGASPSDLPEDQLSQLRAIADMGIAKLGRAWQMMLHGHRELKDAPSPKAAAQMVLIRLAHLAPMPTPADIIKTLQEDKAPASPAVPETSSPAPSSPAPSSPESSDPVPSQTETSPPESSSSEVPPASPPETALQTTNNEQAVTAAPPAPSADMPAKGDAPSFASLRDIADYFDAQNEKILNARIKRHLRVVSFGQHKLEVVVVGDNAEDLPQQLAKSLSTATGAPWLVSVCETGGGKTLAEEDLEIQNKEKSAAADLPLVASVLEAFEGAEITAIKQNDDEDDAPQASENIELAREISN